MIRFNLKSINLITGILLLILFAITGQLMRHYYHNAELPDVERLYRRSRHLFLLLAGLTHSGIGIYIIGYSYNVANKLQWVATGFMFIASCLLIYSFFYEIPSHIIETSVSRMGMYLLLAGGSFHFIAMLAENYATSKSK